MRTDFTLEELDVWHPSNLRGLVLEFQKAYVDMTSSRDLLQTQLTGSDSQVISLRDQLATAHRNHEEDMQRVGSRLIQEANDRDWCEVYDGIVDEINRYLHVPLETRTRDWRVTGTWTITVPFSRTVTARSEDDATSIVEDMEVDSYEMWEAVEMAGRQGLTFESEDIIDAEEDD